MRTKRLPQRGPRGRGNARAVPKPAAALQADPKAVELIAALVRRLCDRQARARCERQPRLTDLSPHQLAVGVSHNDQKDLLRAALAARGLLLRDSPGAFVAPSQ